jgi:microcystin degradation protein MlrC
MRIAVAGFMHESNTFNPLKADRSAFAAQCLKFGPDFVDEWRPAHHEVGGFIAAAVADGHEVLPIGMAWATPSGPVTDDVFEEVTGQFCAALRRQPCDGLLLALHGAMVTESKLDADGETLLRIRRAVGPDLPIVVTFDLHANLSEKMIDNCTAGLTYQTNPHVDQRQCGVRAALILKSILQDGTKLFPALAKPPVIISLAKQDTSRRPLRPFLDQLHFLRTCEPGCWVADFALGFPYADVPQMGPSFLVFADDLELARRKADFFLDMLWAEREEMMGQLPEAAAAVKLALEAERPPVILVDFGDNVGGGSAADGTVLLQALLKQNATGFVVCLYDPDAVQACIRAGADVTLRLTVGGKVDRLHGDPVEVTGTVRLLHDGTYVEPEVRHGGKRVNHMGPTALVELPGNSFLVLSTLRHPPFSLGQLTCLGLEPQKLRFIVVKAAIAYKAAYLPIAGTIIEVDTPGLTAVNPARFKYRHIRRPMFPLEG